MWDPDEDDGQRTKNEQRTKGILPRMRVCLLGGILLALTGCSGGAQDTKPPESGPSAEKGTFKVALLTPGPISDAGWSAMAFDGLKAIEADLGATVNNQEAKGTQIRDAMRAYAQDGAKLVFGHGYEYNEPAIEVAKDFPGTVFVSSSGGLTAPNVGAFRFYLEQGFYLCGWLAGKSTKTGTVGMIGGPDVPSIRSTFKAFRAGAEAARPGIKVLEVFTGQDNDVAAAKQAALKTIEQGADFLIHQANAAAQGVFDACKEKGVWAFGANLDQNENASGVVVASAVIVARPAFVALAKQVRDGTYKGSVVLMGMQDGAIDFRANPALKAKIDAKVLGEIGAMRAKVMDGSLVVPKDEF